MSLGRHPLRYGVQRLIPVALFVALAAATPVRADELAVHPIFTSAETGLGWFTGYRATIQVRPLGLAIWAGGFTSDHLFVQNGLMQTGGGLYAFAWATRDPSDIANGPVPLHYDKVTPESGSWITFELTLTNGRWAFRYQDASGWHAQGSWAAKTHLSYFFATSEYWGTAHRPFPTQVMKDVQLKIRGAWQTPPMLFFGPDPEQCGHELVWSPGPGQLAFRSVETACHPYIPLW
jgi:hypothetical protein